MKQVLQHVRKGNLEIAEVPEPQLKSGGVVVRNAASLISAGTEKMVIDFAGKSMLGKARERPDLVRQVLDRIRKDGLLPTVGTVLSRLDQPIPLGYSCAGVVEQVGRGAEEFGVGDRVACAGMGYASHAHSIFVPKHLTVRIPDNVSFDDAAYVTLGAIALQGVRIAAPAIGERIAVIGLGLLGQLTVQLLRAAGCRVLGVDLDPAKIELARELGADAAVSRSDDVAGAVGAFTAGIGVDATIITAATDSSDPVELAGDLCRDRGRVVVVGAVRMDVPRRTYYEKELELRLSRSYGPGRYDPAYEEGGHDYPIGYVRWTERRNMEEFLRLVATGSVTPGRLTSHRFTIDDAADAYAVVTGETGVPFLGVLLSYPRSGDAGPVRTLTLRTSPKQGRVGIGLIGAGNFAKAVLLPRLAKSGDAALIGVATATGANARTTGQKFGFSYCTTDAERLVHDDSIDALVIATRHGSHARFATEALRAGKSVFVEKPLALNEAELQRVLEAQSTSGALLTVGFNRRFSPLVTELRDFFAPETPLAIQYRINAGAIPAGSWVHDAEQGGGRIIGEICHFVDLVQFLTGDVPVEVFAQSLGGPTAALHDTLTIGLRFRGGSIASINYFANGDKAHGKESLEVFGGEGIGLLDDFRRLTLTRGGRRRRVRRSSQDKGYDQEVTAFIAAVKNAAPPPIDLNVLAGTTRVTFAIEEALRTGAAVRLDRHASAEPTS